MIKQFFHRMRFFFFPPRPSDLDEELQFHLHQATESNLAAGMTAEEARRQAHLLFGAVAATHEQCHQQKPGWWLGTLKQDVRYALRGFRRNPAFALTVMATLALGIGATTAVFSVVDRILFRSLPYAHDDRLVSLGLVQPLERQEFMLGGFYYEWRDHQRPFRSLTFERGTHECNLTEANPIHLQCASVAQNFLPTLGISPLLGRNFLPEEDLPHGPAVALISDGLWLRRFNRDPAVLNKPIMIDEERVRIVGVLPKNFEMPRLQAADIVVPAQMDQAAQHTVNAGIGFPVWAFARLKPGITVQQAKDEMQPLFLHTQQWIPKEFRNEFHLQVRSIRDRQMQETYLVAWVLLGAVLAVLLIACANVASLFSARAAARERELAVRSALGASRGRLIRQTLTEAVLLAAAGAAAGCLLAELLLQVFISIAPAGLPFLTNAHLDLRIISFTLLLSLLCAVLFGIMPALQQPNVTRLVARQTRSAAHARLRRFLVVAQISISVILLSGAGLLLKSFRNLEQQNLGMQTQDVLAVQVPLNAARYPTSQACMDFYLRAEKALERLPGITAVAMSNSVPPDGDSWHDSTRYSSIAVVGQPPPAPSTGGTVVVRAVTPAYFRVLQIPIVQGRDFSQEDRQSGGDFIILSKLLAARLFPQGNAVGQHIQRAVFEPYLKMDGPVFTIVGVAGNVKNQGLANQDDPEYYTLWTERRPEAWSRHHVFLLQTAFPPSVAGPWIRSRIAQLDPILPVEIDTLSQGVTRLADRPRFESALLAFFAACGLLMAVIGLYGIISYVATQRTQEIGVRIALGATRAHILGLIAIEGIRLILLGCLLGLVAALAMAQFLRHLMFHVGPRDVNTYAAVLLLLAGVALVATLIPAMAAMRTDPGEVLRYE
jgi:putative ABC transport system permease protein